MTDHKAMLNEAFHLCYKYHRKHRVFPVRIGINAAHSNMTQSAYTLRCTMRLYRSLSIATSKHEGKMWLYNEQGKADTSTLLHATVFVKLAMLPEVIQEHFRA